MKDKKFDYLIVGAGLFGAIFAHEAREAGKMSGYEQNGIISPVMFLPNV